MKVNRLELKINIPVSYEEEIGFPNAAYDSYHVKNIKSCKVKAIATEYGEYLSVKFEIKGVAVTTCAYTLKDVDYNLNIKDELIFTDVDEENEEFFYEPKPIILLDEYIFSLIVASVPTKVISKDASLPKSGEGYRILSEKELEEERNCNKKSPFDVLDSLDL